MPMINPCMVGGEEESGSDDRERRDEGGHKRVE